MGTSLYTYIEHMYLCNGVDINLKVEEILVRKIGIMFCHSLFFPSPPVVLSFSESLPGRGHGTVVEEDEGSGDGGNGEPLYLHSDLPKQWPGKGGSKQGPPTNKTLLVQGSPEPGLLEPPAAGSGPPEQPHPDR